VKVLKEFETEFLAVRTRTVEKHHGADCASIKELGEEITFCSEVHHCYDTCFVILRHKNNIHRCQDWRAPRCHQQVEILWPTQRSWEQKEASVTPKSHNLWFEVVLQLAHLGRFSHFMEYSIEKLHKLDKLTDAV
jgi:hypothetical protein